MILKSVTPASGGHSSFLPGGDTAQDIVPVLAFLQGKVSFQLFEVIDCENLTNFLHQSVPGGVAIECCHDFRSFGQRGQGCLEEFQLLAGDKRRQYDPPEQLAAHLEQAIARLRKHQIYGVADPRLKFVFLAGRTWRKGAWNDERTHTLQQLSFELQKPIATMQDRGVESVRSCTLEVHTLDEQARPKALLNMAESPSAFSTFQSRSPFRRIVLTKTGSRQKVEFSEIVRLTSIVYTGIYNTE